MNTIALLDPASSPSVRDTIVRLMTSAARADLAISDVRLGAIDLSDDDVAGVASTRLLLARLDSTSLALQPDQLARVHRFGTSGKLQVRCAGLNHWSPDFSVYHELRGMHSACLLFGAHYFRRPATYNTALTTCIVDPAQVARAAAHFEALWSAAYDVLPAIVESISDVLERAHAVHSA